MNGIDPTGMYRCDTEKACDKAKEGIEQIRQARDYYASKPTGSNIARSSSSAKALDGILNSLGKKDNSNEKDVTIATNDEIGERAAGSYDKISNTITIYTKNLSGRYVGETLAHETVHFRQRGDLAAGKIPGISSEVRGLMMQYIVGRAFGTTGGGWRNYVTQRLNDDYCKSASCRMSVNDRIDSEKGRPF